MNGTFVNGIVIDKKSILSGDTVSVLRSDFEILKIEWNEALSMWCTSE